MRDFFATVVIFTVFTVQLGLPLLLLFALGKYVFS